MRRSLWLAAVLLLGGCASVEPVHESETPALMAATHGVQDPPRLVAAPPAAVGFMDQTSFAGPCDGLCHVTVLPDGPTGSDAWLDIRVSWDGAAARGFDLRVESQQGVVDAETRRGFDTARVVVWAPEAVPHRIVVEGDGELRGSVRLRAVDVPAVPGDELLPNLVTLTPLGLEVGQCKIEESVEDGAVRCLRLGNSVGNVGDGPLEVHLDPVNAGLSVAGAGRFVQRIYSDTGHRDVEASGAEFHATHGHFHYAGLAHFELHEVHDGLRGDMVAVGHKRGFCFLDWGPMDTPEAPPERERHAQQNCLVPSASGWSMGMSRGWYDYYWAELADQYIDIEGVPDGTYELVSVADGAGTLLEADETDNKASLIIELAGNRVNVLEERALYDNPEAPEPTAPQP